MNENKLITIIIPVFNGEKYIKETIESGLKQSHKAKQILVIDDGSTDQSSEIIKAFGDQVDYQFQNNQGESVARNKGIELAKGDYIVFLDADDLLIDNALTKYLQVFASNSKAEVVYGDMLIFNDTPDTGRVRKSVKDKDGDLFGAIITGQTLVPGLFMVKAQCLKAMKGFREDYQFGEDWEFLLRLSKAYKFYHLSEIVLHKRTHDQMQSLADNRPDIYDLRLKIIHDVFGSEADQLIKTYLTNTVLADWFRTFGFSYMEKNNRAQARKYIIKSLKKDPFQFKLYLWLLNQLRHK